MTHRCRLTVAQAALVSLILVQGALLIWFLPPLPLPFAEVYGHLFLVLGILAAWDAVATRYQFHYAKLVVRHAFSRKVINFDAIDTIEPCRFLPGTLRLRYRLRYSPASIILTPTDPRKFVADLKRKVPWL